MNSTHHPRPGLDNRQHAYRHTLHALEDFKALAKQIDGFEEEVNTILHHLRHAVYRMGIEV